MAHGRHDLLLHGPNLSAELRPALLELDHCGDAHAAPNRSQPALPRSAPPPHSDAPRSRCRSHPPPLAGTTGLRELDPQEGLSLADQALKAKRIKLDDHKERLASWDWLLAVQNALYGALHFGLERFKNSDPEAAQR